MKIGLNNNEMSERGGGGGRGRGGLTNNNNCNEALQVDVGVLYIHVHVLYCTTFCGILFCCLTTPSPFLWEPLGKPSAEISLACGVFPPFSALNNSRSSRRQKSMRLIINWR